jgi:hypothetical protein
MCCVLGTDTANSDVLPPPMARGIGPLVLRPQQSRRLSTSPRPGLTATAVRLTNPAPS